MKLALLSAHQSKGTLLPKMKVDLPSMGVAVRPSKVHSITSLKAKGICIPSVPKLQHSYSTGTSVNYTIITVSIVS